MKKLCCWIFSSTFFSMTAVSGAQAEQSFEIVVGVHEDVSYSAKDAGKTLTVIRNKLYGKCGPIKFPKARRVSISSDLPDNVIMDSARPDHINLYLATDTSLQMVPAIAACPKPPTTGKIGGCARPGGPILVTKRASRARDAQIWAHEIGHAQGLNSRFGGYVKGHNPNFGSLMFAAANPKNWGMTKAECTQYYTVQTFPPAPASESIIVDEPLAISDEVDSEDEPNRDEDTGNFARDYLVSEWPHGLDVALFNANSNALSEMARVALEEDDVELWPNSVLVAGFANFEGAFELIAKVLETSEVDTEFARSYPEEAAFLINDAKINAGVAIGYLSYHGVPEATDLLVRLISPNRNLASVPFGDDSRDIQQLSQNLAILATTGLSIAVSGNPGLRSIFENHKNASRAGQYDLGVDEAFFDQLEELSKSQQNGSLGDILTDR